MALYPQNNQPCFFWNQEATKKGSKIKMHNGVARIRRNVLPLIMLLPRKLIREMLKDLLQSLGIIGVKGDPVTEYLGHHLR